MKKIIIYGLIIFVFSFGVGYYYSKLWKKENIVKLEETKVLNETVVETTAPIEEKVSFDASFTLKKYYNECGHIHVNHAELPSEFINLTQKEIEENYKEWKVEEFDSKKITLAQSIDRMCDDHFVLKLGNENIEIYQMKEFDDFQLIRETNISREYLTNDDLKKLEEGIFVFGVSNLNSALEDFE